MTIPARYSRPNARTARIAVAICLTIFVPTCAPCPVSAKSLQGTVGNLSATAQASGSDTLPTGTQIQIAVLEKLSSRTAKAGQSVSFEVAKDVMLGSAVAIPTGTQAWGVVKTAKSAGAFGRAGSLLITCDSLTLLDGRHVPVRIDAGAVVTGRDSGGTAAGLGTVTGLAVGIAVAAGSDFNNNGFFNSHPDRTTPVLLGIGSGLATGFLLGAAVHGGDATLTPAQTIDCVLTADLPIHAPSAQGATPSNAGH